MRMQCEFCKQMIEDVIAMQHHLISSCPAIEQEKYSDTMQSSYDQQENISISRDYGTPIGRSNLLNTKAIEQTVFEVPVDAIVGLVEGKRIRKKTKIFEDFEESKRRRKENGGKSKGKEEVRDGRNPGIYNSWKEFEAEVLGCANAKYRKFECLKEAEEFLKETSSGEKEEKRSEENWQCICGKGDVGKKWMRCNDCLKWFHCICVGIKEEDAEQVDFSCTECLGKFINITLNHTILSDTDTEATGEKKYMKDEKEELEEEKIEELEERIEKYRTIIQDNRDHITQLKNDRKIARVESMRQKEYVDEQEKIKAELEKKIGSHLRKISDLEKKLKQQNTKQSDGERKVEEEYKNKVRELQRELSKVKKNLERSHIQYSKVNKEKTVTAEKVKQIEATIIVQNETIEKITNKNNDLQKENETHIDFIQNGFGDEELERSNLQKENSKLQKLVKGKEEEIRKMKTTITNLEKPESEKLQKRNAEVNSLKAQVAISEETIQDLQNERNDYKNKYMVAEVELQREKNINNILIESNISHKILNPNIPGKEEQYVVVSEWPETQCQTESNTSKEEPSKLDQSQREDGTEPLPTSRDAPGKPPPPPIEEAPNKESTTLKGTLKKTTNKTSKHEKEFCEKEFLEGPNTCKNRGCIKEHRMNFRKIRRGICVNEFKKQGSCKWKEKCMFTHEIPDKLKKDRELIGDMNDIEKQIEKKRNRLPSAITKDDERREPRGNEAGKQRKFNNRGIQMNYENNKNGWKSGKRKADQRNEPGCMNPSKKSTTAEIPHERLNIDEKIEGYNNGATWEPFLYLIKTMIQDQIKGHVHQ